MSLPEFCSLVLRAELHLPSGPGLSQIARPPLSSSLESQKRGGERVLWWNPVAGHTSRAAPLHEQCPTQAQTNINGAKQDTGSAPSPLLDHRPFILCKNKGDIPQAIEGKRGRCPHPRHTQRFPHPSTAGHLLNIPRNSSPFGLVSWHPVGF